MLYNAGIYAYYRWNLLDIPQVCQTNKTKKEHDVFTVWRKKKKGRYVRAIASKMQIFQSPNTREINLPKQFLRHNKTLNYFTTENKLHHHEFGCLKLLRMKCDKHVN